MRLSGGRRVTRATSASATSPSESAPSVPGSGTGLNERLTSLPTRLSTPEKPESETGSVAIRVAAESVARFPTTAFRFAAVKLPAMLIGNVPMNGQPMPTQVASTSTFEQDVA